MAYFVFVLAAVLFSVQSAPVDVDSTASASSSAMHLLVKNSEDATNYHLTPLMKEIDDINEEITAELDAMLPYLNFFLDTLFNRPTQEQEGGCSDDMVIQLVPEKSDLSPEVGDSDVAHSTLDVSDDDSSDDDSTVPEVTVPEVIAA